MTNLVRFLLLKAINVEPGEGRNGGTKRFGTIAFPQFLAF